MESRTSLLDVTLLQLQLGVHILRSRKLAAAPSLLASTIDLAHLDAPESKIPVDELMNCPSHVASCRVAGRVGPIEGRRQKLSRGYG